MTLNEFITKWNGKYVDTDNAYGAQCMDLMHQYCVEVLGLTQAELAAPTAKDAFNLNSTHFDKIVNTPTGVPLEGDIIFWGTAPSGHVAIWISGDANNFNSFDQNYPTGSPCHVQSHNYSNVLGWLHPGSNVMVAVESHVFEELVRKSTIADKVVQKLDVSYSEDIILADITKLLTLEDALMQKETQLTEAQGQIETVGKQLLDKEGELKTLQDQLQILDSKINKAVSDNKTMADQIIQLKKDTKPAPALTGWKKTLYSWLIKQ